MNNWESTVAESALRIYLFINELKKCALCNIPITVTLPTLTIFSTRFVKASGDYMINI